ncbi:MFS transporter [Sphingomonas mali]|uniref:MFS transporter n=1 Tax=Sphingomonas mali TaxID=40682 RepID=UPI00082E0626|nr:MFS transporter [Sphingomonas mali]
MSTAGFKGDTARKLGLSLKLSYGSGQAIEYAIATSNTFLLFYLTTVCGLSGVAAGTVFFLSLAVDGLLDPLIGRVSDNWRSRLGRRLPFMMVSLLPMMAAAIALFSIPRGLSGTMLFVYALSFSIVLRASMSLFALPHSALTAELTDDYAERSVISGFRGLFAVVGTAACLVPAFLLIFAGKGGLQSRDAYPMFGAWLAILILAFGLWCLLGAGRAILALPVPQTTTRNDGRHFIAEIGSLFQNPSFVPLFIVAVLVLISQGVTSSLNLHAYRFFWHLPPEQLQLPILVMPIGMIVGTAVAALLVTRFEKRSVLTAAIITIVVGPILLPILVEAGLLQPGTFICLSLLIANGLVLGAGGTVCFVCFYSMMADAVDEHDYLFGVRCEALYAASLMLGAKAATGLGAFLAGLGLQLVGFSATDAAAPSAATVAGVGLLWGPAAAMLLLATLPFLWRYKIDRQHHAAIIASLAGRKSHAERPWKAGSGEPDPVIGKPIARAV